MNPRQSILIVEDDNDLQHFLQDFFNEKGFVTGITHSGKQAIKLAKKSPPSLVILDLGLPDIHGELVCQQLKKNHPDVPVIILTANDDTESVVGTFGKGADDYINKPFNNDELWARAKAKLSLSEKE
jgi:DNA-binding response OmpR family regulator